jgi:ABC-type sugar transport system permease subunit
MPRPPYLLLAPFTLLLAATSLYPLYRAGWWVFHSDTTGQPAFAGLDNIARLLTDRVVGLALLNTLAFTLAYVVILAPLALGLALLFNARSVPFRGLFRAAIFSSHLIGPVYLAVIVTTLLSPRGSSTFDPLAQPLLVLPVLLAATLWSAAGFAMVHLLAALQSVDHDLLDAARIDGATSFQRLRHVTLPAIAPTLAFVSLTATVAGLQLLELPFVLYNGAGPGNAALTLSMVIFSSAFEQADLGYASTLGWLLSLTVTAFAALLLRSWTRVA